MTGAAIDAHRNRRGARVAAIMLAVITVAVALAPAPAARADPPERRRPAAVAGRFYPAEADPLREAVKLFLRDAVSAVEERPVALVAPHAGYLYSGQIAADAWRHASDHDYDVVVILGPNHTVPPFAGGALWSGTSFLTPLGPAEIDRELVAALLRKEAGFVEHPSAHDREHSIEVQLPFIQVALPGVKVVPVVVGGGNARELERLGHALAETLEGRKPLIVASSDLSHYPTYDDAVESDRATLSAIATLDPRTLRRVIAEQMGRGRPGLSTCACGENPIVVAMVAAKDLGAIRGRVISYANSGDSAVADRSRVVGYGAVAFVVGGNPGPETGPPQALPSSPGAEPAPGPPIGEAERIELLAWARETIDRFLTTGTAPLARSLSLACRREQGVFVTLEKHGELRGCIGHMTADLPVGQAVGAMALQAAFNDQRFPPLEPEELDEIEIRISLLGPLSPVPDLSAIVVGRDGVRLEKLGRSAVFLPEVAVEQGWDREQLLDNLCRKGGMPGGCWRENASLFSFRTEVFGEHRSERPK